jgi:hypothetical protein
LTAELANRAGYWYFPRSVRLPDRIAAGQAVPFEMVIENQGYAPAYRRYNLVIRLEGRAQSVEREIDRIDNRRWMPGIPSTESFNLELPGDLAPGQYELKMKLIDPSQRPVRTVFLGLSKEIMDREGFYRLGTITID